jgi:hypothetical protein
MTPPGSHSASFDTCDDPGAMGATAGFRQAKV